MTDKRKVFKVAYCFAELNSFTGCIFLFIKKQTWHCYGKKNDWVIFVHSDLVHFQSHLCEFSCRFSFLQLYIADNLGILVKILRLRSSLTFLENPVPIVSNDSHPRLWGHTLVVRSKGSSSSHSCSGKNVFQQYKNASHWGVWWATMHMQIETADKRLWGHPWRRTTRQQVCTGRKETFLIYLPLMICTSYNKTSWEVTKPHRLMLLRKLTIYTEKMSVSHSQFKNLSFK